MAARGTVVIDRERCKGCELCVSVCPQHVLMMEDAYNRRGYRPVRIVTAGTGQAMNLTAPVAELFAVYAELPVGLLRRMTLPA